VGLYNKARLRPYVYKKVLTHINYQPVRKVWHKASISCWCRGTCLSFDSNGVDRCEKSHGVSDWMTWSYGEGVYWLRLRLCCLGFCTDMASRGDVPFHIGHAIGMG
jgi:hypothetical protein